jgi:hypothetical protein
MVNKEKAHKHPGGDEAWPRRSWRAASGFSRHLSRPRFPEHLRPGTVWGALTLQVGHAGADPQATDFQTVNKGGQDGPDNAQALPKGVWLQASTRGDQIWDGPCGPGLEPD